MFGPFERAVAGRYLRARRGERFVSVIAIFSLVGIALGVATLIIVMSVMGGFKVDLLSRILGFNGHLGVYGAGGTIANFDDIVTRIRKIPDVVLAIPVVDGQVLALDADLDGYTLTEVLRDSVVFVDAATGARIVLELSQRPKTP